jgi:hypothetical protein
MATSLPHLNMPFTPIQRSVHIPPVPSHTGTRRSKVCDQAGLIAFSLQLEGLDACILWHSEPRGTYGEGEPQVSEHIEPRPVAAASRGSARRHRIEGGRRRELKIRFTDAEYDAIIARAADARVSVHRYVADGALAGRSGVNTA